MRTRRTLPTARLSWLLAVLLSIAATAGILGQIIDAPIPGDPVTIGGPTDVAYSGSEADFTQITQVPVFNANLPIGHGGSWQEPAGGKMGKVAFDWLNWQLKSDKAAAKTFVGADCGLCANKEWTVKRANWRF